MKILRRPNHIIGRCELIAKFNTRTQLCSLGGINCLSQPSQFLLAFNFIFYLNRQPVEAERFDTMRELLRGADFIYDADTRLSNLVVPFTRHFYLKLKMEGTRG